MTNTAARRTCTVSSPDFHNDNDNNYLYLCQKSVIVPGAYSKRLTLLPQPKRQEQLIHLRSQLP